MAIVWSRGAFVLRTGEVSASAAGADGWQPSHARSGDDLFCRPLSLGKSSWRRLWTHHAPPGCPGLLSGTRAESASSASSMRCQVQAREQTGPTPPAVDTAFEPAAYVRAGRPDTLPLAPPLTLRVS